MENSTPLPASALPPGVRSRFIDHHNGCVMHVLEAGFDPPGRPCVVLLHGFPELAFSWRNQLPFLAQAGFHVIAPDQRGYGRSGGTDVGFGDDLWPYTPLNRVSDTLGLVRALGHERVAAVIGHDYGAHVAGWCALIRPDVFRALVLMSATFAGPPSLPLGSAQAAVAAPGDGVQDALAGLASLPRPRKHYWQYYATPEANADVWRCPQGVHDFLRAYFHFKSADWPGNKPFLLQGWTAGELEKMPTYYIMDRNQDMARTVARQMPSAAQIASCKWLTEDQMAVYSEEYSRTGFQGGLQAYRILTDPRFAAPLRAFSGRTVDVPSRFISGALDWGTHQVPHGLERLRRQVCTRMEEPALIEGAGHWVQQEAAAKVNALLLEFLQANAQGRD